MLLLQFFQSFSVLIQCTSELMIVLFPHLPPLLVWENHIKIEEKTVNLASFSHVSFIEIYIMEAGMAVR